MAYQYHFRFDVAGMKRTTFFITGTDTGVGKTVLTALLARHLRERGVSAAALKPVCSGRRDDARALRAAMNGALTPDEINPWHFRAPLAPLLAARRERRRVGLADVLAHVRTMQKRFNVLLVEGAGGLLSPLGENFDSRDLIAALRATPIVVCPNRLGAVNQVLLTLAALPRSASCRARVVLISPSKPDASTSTNVSLLAEFLDAKRIFCLPRLGGRFDPEKVLKDSRVRRTFRVLVK
ncbi:MAG TPA: dethiobiotin synthase [Verrucomicrobiae bacterium]